MNWKRIDPKIVVSWAVLLIVSGSTAMLLWWASDALKRAQQFKDPVQQTIQKDGLL